jgi:purine-binding chemotaxis protein CheW
VRGGSKRQRARQAAARKLARPRSTQRRRRPAGPEPAIAPSADRAAREEQRVVADLGDVSQPSTARFDLPASGLADEILSRADVAAVEVAMPARSESAQQLTPIAPEPVSRSHNISFFSVPQREERRAVEATEHLATFFLAGEEYGVDVRLVQEIIRLSEITQVPRAPEFIRGVINLRGRIIPVIDLKRKLGLGAVELSRQSRIVVANMDERAIGLLVDGASQVLRVPVSCIEQPPEEIGESNASYIRGVAKLEARLIILVDLRKALALELGERSETAAR